MAFALRFWSDVLTNVENMDVLGTKEYWRLVAAQHLTNPLYSFLTRLCMYFTCKVLFNQKLNTSLEINLAAKA